MDRVANSLRDFDEIASNTAPGGLIPVSESLLKKLNEREQMRAQIHSEHSGIPYNPVDAPEHYLQTRISAAEVIADWNLDFFLGSVLKYINRYKYKNEALLDLQKARQYLTMEIELIEKGELKDSIKHG